MSSFRHNYIPVPARRGRASRTAMALLAVPLVVAAVLWAIAQHQADPPPAAAVDARTAERLEAFRAGYQAAVQQGCKVALVSPIGGQP